MFDCREKILTINTTTEVWVILVNCIQLVIILVSLSCYFKAFNHHLPLEKLKWNSKENLLKYGWKMKSLKKLRKLKIKKEKFCCIFVKIEIIDNKLIPGRINLMKHSWKGYFEKWVSPNGFGKIWHQTIMIGRWDGERESLIICKIKNQNLFTAIVKRRKTF